MRMLVVAPRFPWPLTKGDRLTVYYFLRHFSENNEIDLCTFGEDGFGDDFQPEFIEKVMPLCREVEVVPLRKKATYVQAARSLLDRDPLQVWYFRRERMFAKVREMLAHGRYDLIYTHLLRMAQYTYGLRGLAKVLAMQISLSLHYRRLAEHQEYLSNPLKKRLYRLEARKLREYEAQMTRCFDRVLLVGQADRAEVVGNSGDPSRIFLNPHGVDLDRFRPTGEPKIECSITFAGNMSSDPNVDAVLWFYERIFPEIKARIPEVRFFIFGVGPSKRVRHLNKDPSVSVTGYVEDLPRELSRCQVAVDPLRIGAGLQNKVLEAMALELPIVVTPVANEGIGAPDGTGVVIAGNEGEFASRVVSLLRDSEQRELVGQGGREWVLEHFTWEKHYHDLEELFLELVADGKP